MNLLSFLETYVKTEPNDTFSLINKFQAELDELKRKAARFDDDQKTINQQRHEIENYIASSHAKNKIIKELRDKIEELEKSVVFYQNREMQTNKTIEEQKTKLNELQKRTTALETMFFDQNRKFSSLLDTSREETRLAINASAARRKELTETISKLELQIADYRNQINALSQELHEMKEARDALSASLTAHKNQDVTIELPETHGTKALNGLSREELIKKAQRQANAYTMLHEKYVEAKSEVLQLRRHLGIQESIKDTVLRQPELHSAPTPDQIEHVNKFINILRTEVFRERKDNESLSHQLTVMAERVKTLYEYLKKQQQETEHILHPSIARDTQSTAKIHL